MNVNKLFPSPYLKASDIGDAKPLVVIEKWSIIEMEENGRMTSKGLLNFVGKDAGLVLNKTNADALTVMFGPEMDDWIGKKIKLYTKYVEFSGKNVLALRIEINTSPANGSKPPPVIDEPIVSYENAIDEIPF